MLVLIFLLCGSVRGVQPDDTPEALQVEVEKAEERFKIESEQHHITPLNFSIQHLNLKMNSGKIGREEIEILTNSIAKFKGLDSIEMNLMRNNLTGEEAITVSEAINNFLDVRSLVLYLEGNKIGPSGSSVIFSKFFDMTKLQLLRLNLNPASDWGMLATR